MRHASDTGDDLRYLPIDEYVAKDATPAPRRNAAKDALLTSMLATAPTMAPTQPPAAPPPAGERNSAPPVRVLRDVRPEEDDDVEEDWDDEPDAPQARAHPQRRPSSNQRKPTAVVSGAVVDIVVDNGTRLLALGVLGVSYFGSSLVGHGGWHAGMATLFSPAQVVSSQAAGLPFVLPDVAGYALMWRSWIGLGPQIIMSTIQ